MEEMGMPLDLLIFEGIAAIITVVAIVILFIASIKIYKAGNIPGSKLILGSLIGSIVVPIISLLPDEENNIIMGIIEVLIAIIFLLGVLGFLKLSKYIYEKNANKAIKKDV